MDVLKNALENYFDEIYKKMNHLCWDINENYLNQNTLDEVVHILNNIHILEKKLQETQTSIDLALLSVDNTEKEIKRIKKYIHSG